MNLERIQLKGQLSEAKKRLKEVSLEAKGLIILIRNYLNPYADDLSEINSAEALQSMKRLDDLLNSYKDLKDRIKELEDAIDG